MKGIFTDSGIIYMKIELGSAHLHHVAKKDSFYHEGISL